MYLSNDLINLLKWAGLIPDNEDRHWALVNPIDGEIPIFDLFSPEAEYIGSIQAPDRVQNVQFVPDNYILFSYESDDTDVWKGALYQILDKQKSFKTNYFRKSAFLNHGITSIAY